MAKKSDAKVKRVYIKSEKRKTHKRKEVVHLLPAVAEFGGLVEPLLVQNDPSMGPALYDFMQQRINGDTQYPTSSVPGNIIGSYRSGWEIPVGGVLLGIVLKWVGKKTGLNKFGTKRVKIL